MILYSDYFDPHSVPLSEIFKQCCDLCLGDQLTINMFNPHESMQRWCTCGDVIQNRDLGNVLDVADMCMDPGARVCAWDRNGGPNQSFTFEFQLVHVIS